ncbi:hypothetical protein [Bacillus cereus]|uniref:hypothetical protein n=1 Tax=Bacillus cereus TaxID=1396 RepID=UPI0036725895
MRRRNLRRRNGVIRPRGWRLLLRRCVLHGVYAQGGARRVGNEVMRFEIAIKQDAN